MKDLPEEDRPYEKCLKKGAASLTDTELLAVILRSGHRGGNSLALAQEILEYPSEPHQGLLGLHHLTTEELRRIPGIGKVKAVQLKCIGELTKRMAKMSAYRGLSFQNPAAIAEYYMEQIRHEEQEVLILVMLDARNNLLADQILSRGTVNGTLLSPRELFLEALRYHAVNLILIHNHPSGDPTPSSADLNATRKIYHAGELMDIHLLDHIVVGNLTYISMREEALIDEFSS